MSGADTRIAPSAAAQQLSPLHILLQMVVDSSRHSAAQARLWAFFCALGLAIFGPLEWRYDMLPTLAWLESHGVALQATMAAAYGQMIGSSSLLIAPLVIKSLTARWAHQFALLGSLFVCAELADIITNWDAAWELFNSFAPAWAAAPPTASAPLQWLGYWALFLVVLVVTTSVFQIICIACLFCLVVALWNSFARPLTRWLIVGGIGAIVALWVLSHV